MDYLCSFIFNVIVQNRMYATNIDKTPAMLCEVA
jgi:hypothetical protein